ncbi:hypothetical protein CVV38_01715 [Candidatus Peregrinibacteria bacterium HGW-Peregrinibacteria-1]|jgi:small-conductance mechanosensitive channel|nr:MAG: hypothetical protein CVV38_01715 [Candidatus Peregrinibacteria bacterium HGW-Peregrinibacteria-1]
MNFSDAKETAEVVTRSFGEEIQFFFASLGGRIPLWITAFIVAIIALIIAKISRRIIERKLAKHGIEEENNEMEIIGGRITYVVILVIGFTSALKIAGIDVTTIVAAVAVGAGFAMQDLIINFLGGVMILAGKHFTIGDYIKIEETVGKVVDIQARVTVLQALDGTKVVVPNSSLFLKQVVSFTSNPFMRIDLMVGIDNRNDLEKVIAVCNKVFTNTKGVLVEPKPAVVVAGFDRHVLNLEMRAWIESRSGWVRLKSDLAKNIKHAFDINGIKMAMPLQITVAEKELALTDEKVKTEDPMLLTAEEKPMQPTSVPKIPQALPVQAPQVQPSPINASEPAVG